VILDLVQPDDLLEFGGQQLPRGPVLARQRGAFDRRELDQHALGSRASPVEIR
jgi:hypothetical protein